MPQWNIAFCDQPHALAPEIERLSDRFTFTRIPPELSRRDAIGLLADKHIFHNPTGLLKVDDDLLDQCPGLLYCSPDGAGYDAIDVPACSSRGICVANQTGLNAATVAETAVSMALALAHRLMPADHAMKTERNWTRMAFTGRDLVGGTLGVIGFGNIGQQTAALCRGGLRMNVLAYDPFIDPSKVRDLGAEAVDLDTLLSQSDVVSIHMPLTDQTRHMIGAAQLARMKKDSILITTSRGGIVQEDALAQVLASGHLWGAGVDVWETEPPPLEHALLRFDNVLATPHIAGSTIEGYRSVSVGAAEQIVAAMSGVKPPRLLNEEAWPQFLQRLGR